MPHGLLVAGAGPYRQAAQPGSRTQYCVQHSAAAGVREVLPCKFDGNAVSGYQFTPNDVSTLDYFHPSVTGQSRLASLTWSQSWWS